LADRRSSSSEFFFCGGKALTSLPYCAYHSRVAYQPAVIAAASHRSRQGSLLSESVVPANEVVNISRTSSRVTASPLSLEERAFARVSKDGRESALCVHPRDACFASSSG